MTSLTHLCIVTLLKKKFSAKKTSPRKKYRPHKRLALYQAGVLAQKHPRRAWLGLRNVPAKVKHSQEEAARQARWEADRQLQQRLTFWLPQAVITQVTQLDHCVIVLVVALQLYWQNMSEYYRYSALNFNLNMLLTSYCVPNVQLKPVRECGHPGQQPTISVLMALPPSVLKIIILSGDQGSIIHFTSTVHASQIHWIVCNPPELGRPDMPSEQFPHIAASLSNKSNWKRRACFPSTGCNKDKPP